MFGATDANPAASDRTEPCARRTAFCLLPLGWGYVVTFCSDRAADSGAVQKLDTIMETSLVKEKLCVFISLALVVMNAAAEHQYFKVDENRNWTEARMYCQVCYKDLVTVTSENSHIIAQMINCSHWIGLRKVFASIRSNNQSACNSTFTDGFPYSSDNSTSSLITDWMQWANGDLVSFQNWYPGWPAPKFPLPKIDCCSCSCTCPVSPEPTTNNPTQSPFQTTTSRNASSENTTVSNTTFSNTTVSNTTFSNTTFSNTTVKNTTFSNTTSTPHTTYSLWSTTPRAPMESTCESRPVQPPVIPEPYKNYIEDSCVAMLSFGPWIEKHCTELLPFVCYEDRFMGEVNVTNITSKSASLSWLSAPGNISHYRVEVNEEWLTNLTVLTLDLTNLTAGTGYRVQVFPVKCERDLNPQNKMFYTIPPTVENLNVTSITETSVTLSWNKPGQHQDFYQIGTDADNRTKETSTESLEFDGLTRGTCYKFIVITGVKDRSMWSEAASIAQCTKPGMVTKLRATKNSNTSVTLVWDPPDGHYTGFIVSAKDSSNYIKELMNTTEVLVDNLSDGKHYSFIVWTVANFTLQGEGVTIETYTAPNQISNLRLITTYNSLYASWEFKNDSDVKYRAELRLAAEEVNTTPNLSETEVNFTNLKTAAKYNVTVYAVIESVDSLPVWRTMFTLPSPPRNARFSSSTTDSITFEWDPPNNISSSGYSVLLYSDFWNSSYKSDTDIDQTNYTFTGLKSGSKYNFEVRTNTGMNTSAQAIHSGWTEFVQVTVGLSMLCSSQTPLLCDSSATKKSVSEALKLFFNDMLSDNIIWNITHKEIQNA